MYIMTKRIAYKKDSKHVYPFKWEVEIIATSDVAGYLRSAWLGLY